jgi:hypothetical protein
MLLSKLKTDCTVRFSFITAVVDDRPMFHVDQVATWSSVSGAASIAVLVRACVYHIAFNCVVPFVNANVLVLALVNVTVSGEEGTQVMFFDPFLRLRWDEGELALTFTAIVLGALCWVNIGIVATLGVGDEKGKRGFLPSLLARTVGTIVTTVATKECADKETQQCTHVRQTLQP